MFEVSKPLETPPLIDFSSDHESLDVERTEETTVTTQLTNSFQPYIWLPPAPETMRDNTTRQARHRVRGRVDIVKNTESGVLKPVVNPSDHPMEKTSVDHQQDNLVEIVSDEEENLIDNDIISFRADSSHNTEVRYTIDIHKFIVSLIYRGNYMMMLRAGYWKWTGTAYKSYICYINFALTHKPFLCDSPLCVRSNTVCRCTFVYRVL